MERQKFIAGTSDSRGSPQYNESNVSSQRKSTVCRIGAKVPSVSPPKPLKAASIASGFLRLNSRMPCLSASQLRRMISSFENWRAAPGVAMVKLAKSNLNSLTPRSYQNCIVSINCARNPPSKKHMAEPVASIELRHSGMTSNRNGTFEATQRPGLIWLSRQACNHRFGPFGQFGCRNWRYPPLVEYQKVSIT